MSKSWLSNSPTIGKPDTTASSYVQIFWSGLWAPGIWITDKKVQGGPKYDPSNSRHFEDWVWMVKSRLKIICLDFEWSDCNRSGFSNFWKKQDGNKPFENWSIPFKDNIQKPDHFNTALFSTILNLDGPDFGTHCTENSSTMGTKYFEHQSFWSSDFKWSVYGLFPMY